MERMSNMYFHFRYLILFIAVSSSMSSISQTETEKEIKFISTKIDSIDLQRDKLLVQLEELKFNKIQDDLSAVGNPICSEDVEVIYHKAMILGYNENHEQAQWVSHIVLPDVEKGNVSRTNNFRKDSLVTSGTASKADYWYSGYDRGHLAPSADFRWSKTALSESYFYSNMAPQLPDLNREKWAELENTIREYVIENKMQVYVVTGGVLNDSLPRMLNKGRENTVSIPSFFYKVILDNFNHRSIGFVMPNGNCNYPIMSYAISIDSVEALTGLNFFSKIKDEGLIEQQLDINIWQSGTKKGDVIPINPITLEKGMINTVQAQYNIGTKSTVCGTVVSTKYSEKSGATFLNLDKKFPNQIFSVTIWKDSRANFSYIPEIELQDRKVCITGKIENNKGTPTMNISTEKSINIITEENE
jgi:endonuclease G, mitochondrial